MGTSDDAAQAQALAYGALFAKNFMAEMEALGLAARYASVEEFRAVAYEDALPLGTRGNVGDRLYEVVLAPGNSPQDGLVQILPANTKVIVGIDPAAEGAMDAHVVAHVHDSVIVEVAIPRPLDHVKLNLNGDSFPGTDDGCAGG